MTRVATGWRSWHLHVDSMSPTVMERALLEVAVPVVPAGHGWFFIRYWQGGPHLRLRIADLSEDGSASIEADLARRLAAFNEGLPDEGRPTTAAYQRVAGPLAALGEGGTPLPLDDLVPCGVHRHAYEPELDRYGGAALIGLSERLFHASSVATVAVCRDRVDRDRRIADGLEVMAAALSAWPDPRALTASVRDGWLAWLSDVDVRFRTAVADLTAQVRPGASALRDLVGGAPSRWTAWTRPLAAATEEWTARLGGEAARQIFVSHLHMTQNRLGVGGGIEAILAATLLEYL